MKKVLIYVAVAIMLFSALGFGITTVKAVEPNEAQGEVEVLQATVGVSISPVQLDFGSVYQGHTSQAVPVTVTNTGQTDITITIITQDEFFAPNLRVGDGMQTIAQYVSPVIPEGESLVIDLYMAIPYGASVETHTTASPIIFVGTAIIP